jgi:hypothetical protein
MWAHVLRIPGIRTCLNKGKAGFHIDISEGLLYLLTKALIALKGSIYRV